METEQKVHVTLLIVVQKALCLQGPINLKLKAVTLLQTDK